MAALEEFERAAASFEVGDTRLVIDLQGASEATVPQRPIDLPDAPPR